MKKILLLFLFLFFITGCFSKDLSEEEFESKNLAGTYTAYYISDDTGLEYEFLFEIDQKRNLISALGESEVKIDKNYKVEGIFTTETETINYQGSLIIDNQKTTGNGTWSSSSDKGTWRIEKGVSQTDNEEEEEELETSSYNMIDEELADISNEQLSLMQSSLVPIPGGHLQFFDLKYENIMGTPSDTITSYSVGIYTATDVATVRTWIYQEVANLGWDVFENYDFDDGYGSFNLIVDRDDSIKRMYLGATQMQNYSFITIKFD